MARGPKKHMKRLNAPKHWMLDKLGGTWVRYTTTGAANRYNRTEPSQDAACQRHTTIDRMLTCDEFCLSTAALCSRHRARCYSILRRTVVLFIAADRIDAAPLRCMLDYLTGSTLRCASSTLRRCYPSCRLLVRLLVRTSFASAFRSR